MTKSKKYFVMTYTHIGGKKDKECPDITFGGKVRPIRWKQVSRRDWEETDGLKYWESKDQIKMFAYMPHMTVECL